MKVELFINNSLCDLKGGENIEVDYTNFDITKIDSRGGARSYSFSLPKTNKNKTILENPEMVDNLSMVPYTRLDCRVYVDGVDTLIRFAEVASVKDSYEVRLYGISSDLFNKIKDKTLRELDMSELNHYWKQDNIIASFQNTTGFIYPIIDYHLDSPNGFINNDNQKVRCDYLLPAIFYNYALNKIFELTGYTFINPLGETTKDIIIPAFSQAESNFFAPKKYEGVFHTDSNFNVGIFGGIVSRYTFNAVTDYAGNYYQLPYTSAYSPYEQCLKIQDAINFHIKLEIEVIQPDAYPQDLMVVMFWIDNTGTPSPATIDFPFNLNQGTNNITIEYDMSAPSNNAELFIGFEQSPLTGQMVITNNTTAEISDVVIQNGQLIIYGQYLSISDILPNIPQIDLVKMYLQMFCLLPIINDVTKEVILIKFDDLLSNIANAYDWSNLIDFTNSPELRFIQNEYAQHNKFIYKQDGDEPKPIGTDGEIIIANNNLEYEKEIISLDFAGTNSVKRLVDVDVSQIGIFENGEYKAEREPRVLNIERKVLPTFSVYDDIVVGSGTFAYPLPVPYFIKADKDFNLGWGNSLLANYYKLLTNILHRVKILTVEVRLSASDISQLDFSRPVFIKEYDSYFYISSVKGFSYTESKSTIVELVKLNING